MRQCLMGMAALLLLSVAEGEELPAAVAKAVKARDYTAALEAAQAAKVNAETLADIKALAAAKKRVIDGASSGRRRTVTLTVMGSRTRARITAADREGYTVTMLGAERKESWETTTDLRFYRIAKRYIDGRSGADHLMLARAALAMSLAEPAEAELTEAVRRDFKLRATAAKLRERLTGMAGAPGAPAVPGGPRGPAAPVKRPANAVATGYESGVAARRMSAADRQRLASLPLQNLIGMMEGRYTQLKDDGVMGHWGLDAVKARQDATNKPYAELKVPGGYQTERVIFADPGTGVTMMKLSDEPYGTGDEILYFGKAAFTADGSKMVWQRSRKPSLWGPGSQASSDTHGPIVRDGDGSRPRIAFRERPSVRIPICHPTDPGLAYAYSGRDVVELDMRTEKVKRVVASGLPMWWLKLSPDGKYVCSAPYGRGQIAVVRIEDGKRWNIPLRRNIHDSYRFVPGNTDQVMFWYEGRGLSTEGFHTFNYKTGEDTVHKVRFDWNHGDVGRHVGFHCSGRITRFDGKKWHPYEGLIWPRKQFNDTGPWYDNPVSANGYAQHWPDDELWAYGTRIVQRPYLSEVTAFFAEPFKGDGRVNRFRVCFTNLMRRNDRKGAKTVVLDRPNVSYDGTKMLFNTNVFGLAEVFMAVIRKPRPPVDVEVGGTKITWEAPKYSQEIAGYRVYASAESGRGFMPVGAELVRGTEYPGARAGSFYAVRSVEHSGLESGLSAEVFAGDVKAAPLRIFAEAEDAIRAELGSPSPDGIWRNIDGLASDLHYVWQRRKDKPGRVELTVNAPRAGHYTVFARVKGAQGAQWQVGSAAVTAGASSAWQWVKGGATPLKAGANKVVIASSKYGSCLDCVYFSTDTAFKPRGRILAARPAKLTLSADRSAGGKPHLTWSGKKDARWYHYNLYCGSAAGFTCDRAALVASPDAERHIDWSAPGGAKFYRVTQVTLDGLESEPSDAVAAE